MAHAAQRQAVEFLKAEMPYYFLRKRVWEIGSLNINGADSDLFENCDYVALDLGKGHCVNTIGLAHEYDGEPFDVVFSCESLEHDKYWRETLQNMVRLLKPGGLMFFTCATGSRAEHGTASHKPGDSPFTSKRDDWKDYYRNLYEEDIADAIDLYGTFQRFCFNSTEEDLYFWGIKKEEEDDTNL
jgi:SAM-dependent methyltransferase